MIKKHMRCTIFLLVILAILICIPRNVYALINEERNFEYSLNVYVGYNEYARRDTFTVVTDYKGAEKYYVKNIYGENISGLNYINNTTYVVQEYKLYKGAIVEVVLLDKDNKVLTKKKIKFKNPLIYEEEENSVLNIDKKENKVIKFNDKYFENAIRKKVGKSSGDITLSDVSRIDCLYLDDEIKNLEGIQYFNSLIYLNIENNDINSIKNISLLGELPKLASFNGKIISRNGNIEFIKNLKNLKYLTINSSKIEDISAIGNLKELKYVEMDNNIISDISCLKNLKNIEHLSLNTNKITDISALKDSKNIKDLYLTDNNIKDISCLKELTKLGILYLRNNNISSIESLHNLDGLYYLCLKGNTIEDFSPVAEYYDNIVYKDFNFNKPEKDEIIVVKDSRLAESLSRVQDEGYIYKEYVKTFKKLEIINSQNEDFEDNVNFDENDYVYNIDGIEYLENVKEIKLIHNKIKNIDKLKQLKNIEVLDLTDNEIKDISALKSLTNLKILILKNNYIEDITPLKELTNLEYVDLSENNIANISGIEDLTNVKSLYLNKNKITNISKLRGLTNLRTVALNDNMIKDIQVIGNLKVLNIVEFRNNCLNNVNVLDELPRLDTVMLANNPIKEFSSIPEFYDYCSVKDIEIINISNDKYKFVNKIKDYNSLTEAIKNDGYFVIEDENIKQVYEKSQKIINNIIKDSMTDIEKEIAIHDFVVNNAKYDNEKHENDIIPAESYTPYGILIKGTGLSEGYAKTMNLLLNMAGIDCSVIYGRANGGLHAWNIVKLDGEYYHLDATLDDNIDMDSYKGGKKEILRHEYFNLSDEQMRKDHQWYSKTKCIGKKFICQR